MGIWNDINMKLGKDTNFNIKQFEIELNRRLRHALNSIDVSQLIFKLNDIDGTLILSKGGTGASLSAPVGDRIMFYDSSGFAVNWLDLDTNLEIVGTKLDVIDTWEDLQFPIDTGKVPASSAPTFELLTTNVKAYSFAVGDNIQLQANEAFHGSIFDNTASFHVHVTNKTANSSGSSQYVKVQLDVAYAQVNGVWAEQTLTGECEIPNGTPAKTKKICSVSNFDLSNVLIGGQIKPLFTRITATGGTEYADNVFITQVGLHIDRDQVGSREPFAK